MPPQMSSTREESFLHMLNGSKKWKSESCSSPSPPPSSMNSHHCQTVQKPKSSSPAGPKSCVQPCSRQTEAEREVRAGAESTCSEAGASSEVQCEREETKTYFRNYYKFQSERDFTAFWRSFELLENSRWFHTGMDRDEAKMLLEKAAEGTFLLRPSASPSHVFTLSLRLKGSPVSCRINYRRGLFKLDSVGDDATNPWFEDVVQLVDWYVRSTRRDPQKGGLSFVMQHKGEKRTYGTARVVSPARTSVPSLAHWARLAVNQALPEFHLPSISVDKLPVPEKVKSYLKEYPYIV